MKISAAVLGAGEWARSAHIPALLAAPDVDLVACADSDVERARAAAREFGIPAAYGSLDAMFASESDLSLLVIAAPDDVHPIAISAALDRKIAVFCEKPLANDVEIAESLSTLAERAGVPATVGYSFRYSPAVQALRADLAAGALGVPWLIEVAEHNAQFHPLLGKKMNWKGDPAHAAGGALFEYGSHVLDLCSWLLGPIESVTSHLVRVLPDAKLDDIATLQLKFAGGAAGTLVSSWLLTGGFPGIRIRLHSSQGLFEVELNDTVPNRERYVQYNLDGSVGHERDLPATITDRSSYARLHLADLLAELRINGSTPTSSTLPTIRQAFETQRVLECALAATASWVDVAPGAAIASLFPQR